MAYRARSNEKPPPPDKPQGPPEGVGTKDSRKRRAQRGATGGAPTAYQPPPPPPPDQPGDAIVRAFEEQSGKISTAKVILQTMDEAGAKAIPISDNLLAAVPAIAAKLMTSENSRKQVAGAKLVVGAAKYNLARFTEANKTDPVKVEQSTQGDTYNITIMPPPGAVGELPYPAARKKVENTAR